MSGHTLKRCPFCESELIAKRGERWDHPRHDGCPLSMRSIYQAAVWNERPIERELLEALDRAIPYLEDAASGPPDMDTDAAGYALDIAMRAIAKAQEKSE